MSGGREAPAKIAGSRLIRHLHRVYFAILEWNRAQPRHVQLVGAIAAAFAFVVMSLAVANLRRRGPGPGPGDPRLLGVQGLNDTRSAG